MIELRSDTFTLPTAEMRTAIAEAALGDDVYGEDPTVTRLERLAADTLGKDAACLMPSGTMANLASILTHCPRGSRVLVGNESDIFIYEAAGASVCGGIAYEPIPTGRGGQLALSDLECAFPPDPDDPQYAPVGLICLENTHNRCCGAVLGLTYLAEVAEFAAMRGVPVHLDGARMFNAAVALGVAPAEIARYAASVQVCLSKGLASPVGSIVAGSTGFITGVRRARKMLGGGMRQAGIIAAAGIVSLEQMIARLADDHHTARLLAQGLSGVRGIELDAGVQTNIVMFRVTDPRWSWRTFISAAADRGVNLGELGHGRIRAVTHLGVTERDVNAAVSVIADLVGDR